MKRYIATFAVICAALVSCQTSEKCITSPEIEYSTTEALSFDPAGGKMTKVDKDATEFSTETENNNDDFGAIIYVSDGAASVNDFSNDGAIAATQYMDNDQIKYLDDDGTGEGTEYVWKSTKDIIYYWPVDSDFKLNTFAYSPYSSDANCYPTKFGYKTMTIESYDNSAGDVNLMGAMTFDQTADSDEAKMNLKFYRTLAQMRFNISLDNSATTEATTAISAIYTDDKLLPETLAAKDAATTCVYSGADVYLLQIRVRNVPVKADCSMSLETGTFATKWDSTNGTLGDYTIYTADGAAAQSYLYGYTANNAGDTYTSTGKLLTTVTEGAQDEDDYTEADAMNPFFRPMVISPFSTYNTAGVSTDLKTTLSDPTTDPHIEFVYYVKYTTEISGKTGEIVVQEKPINALLAPNSRLTYNVQIKLDVTTFVPTIADITPEDE